MARDSREAAAAGKAGHDRAADGGHEPEHEHPSVVHTGNPRITVAFPFSRIETREPSEALRDLAALVLRLAGQLHAVTRELTPEQAEVSDRLVADAKLLAIRLGAGP